MGQNVNPATPPAPNKDALSLGATDATTMALKTLAEHIGAAAANARLQQNGVQAGVSMGGGAQVQVPSPAILPPAQQSGPMPMIGGGYDDKWRQDKADMTTMFNTVKHGLDAYTQKKNQEIAVKAARDYDGLMKAYQINQSLEAQLKDNPDNQQLQQMVAQNKKYINDFFADDKRTKRLQKVMGIEMESKAAAAQGPDPKIQAKQNDPDYQGFKMAQKGAVPDSPDDPFGHKAMPGPDGGTLPQVNGQGASQPLGQENLGMPSNIKPPWLSGLNDRAASFFGRQPVGPSTPTYVPSPAELGEAWRVANKIAPDGNSRNELLKTITEWNSRGLTTVFTDLNQRDMKEAELNVDKYKADLDAGTKSNIALADIGMKQAQLRLDTWYKTNDIFLRNKEMELKAPDTYGKIYDQGVDIADKNFKIAQEGYLAAQKAADTAKNIGTNNSSTKKGNSDLIAAWQQKMEAAHQKLAQVTKEREDFYGRTYHITSSPSGAGTGAAVINKLEGSQAGAPAPTANSGASPAPAAVPVSGSSSTEPTTTGDKLRDWTEQNISPFFGGKRKGPI